MAVGVDIEDISRFKGKSKEFLKRIFTPLELEYCMKFKNSASHLAVRFCAKEAVIKALSGLSIKISEYKAIEIYQENKVPKVRILKQTNKIITFDLSLSHDRTKAIAFVIAEVL